VIAGRKRISLFSRLDVFAEELPACGGQFRSTDVFRPGAGYNFAERFLDFPGTLQE
jgi:hypothetical protein